jgi:RND family efflux transporter MFP subunit
MSEQSQPGHNQDHASGPDSSRPPALSGRRALILLALLLVVAVVLAVTGILPRIHARTTLAEQTNSLAAPDVLVAPPTRGQPSQEIVLPGSISAYADASIFARTNGYLKKWYFDIGAHVKKGQLIAVIESPEVDQQLAQAKADLATAETTAGLAKTNAERYQGLLKGDAVSQQDTDTFVTQAASTNTQVKSAIANVQRLQQLVDFEQIIAPFDGVITVRNVDIGTLVDSGSGARELFHVAAINTLRVYVNVPQIDSRSAVRGTVADLTLAEFPGRRFQGKLVRTSDSIDPASRTLLAEFDIDNRKGELYPGAYAEVHFKLDNAQPAIVVPVSTLIFRSEGLRIATVVNGNQAKLVPVVLGRDDGKVVEVVSGLQAGDTVIQNPPDSLIDGETVHVVQPQPQPGAQKGSE